MATPGLRSAWPETAWDLLPEVAVDAVNGNLYAVWMDARFDGGLSVTDHDGIAFTRSTDAGRTWSATIKVNKTPTGEPNDDQQAFTPSAHVDDNGTVVVTYYDLRNNTPDPANLDADHFAVSCESTSENCTDAGELGGGAHHAHLVQHPHRHRSPAATSWSTTWDWTTPATTRPRSSAIRSLPRPKTVKTATSARHRRSNPRTTPIVSCSHHGTKTVSR